MARQWEAVFRRGVDPSRSPIDPEAKARARELLRSYLTPGQRERYDITGTVLHPSKRPQQEYGIRAGRSYNVIWYDHRKRRHQQLCCIPQGAHEMPDEDIMIAQLLTLRADEEGFLRRANKGGWENR